MEKPTSFDYPVIDTDLHIFEHPAIFHEFLEPKWLAYAKENYPLNGENPGLSGLSRCLYADHDEISQTRALTGHQYRMHCSTEEAYPLNQKEPDYWFPGTNDGEVRLGCMDAEGIDSGIVRNTQMASIFHLPESENEFIAALCRAYNDWVRDFCDADPTRLFPEALLPCGDMDATLKELKRTADMGFIGTVVRGSSAGLPLSDQHYDPLWAQLQEMKWPLCIHAAFDAMVDSGAQFLMNENKLMGSSAGAFFGEFLNLNFMLDNIVTLGEITLGGMCDKFPKLPIYFIESGHSWIGEVLYRLDKDFTNPFTGVNVSTRPDFEMFANFEIAGTTKPSEIFQRQIFTQFEGGDALTRYSPEGIEALVGNLVWASDIPHWDGDGPWEGVNALRSLNVTDEVERKIMGGNASKLLNIPYQKKVGTSDKAKKVA